MLSGNLERPRAAEMAGTNRSDLLPDVGLL